MAYQNNENNDEREKHRRIDNLADNNPWITQTPEDLNRQSTMIADKYITTRLRGEPDGVTSSKVKRDLESLFSVKDETLQRYTLRKVAYDSRVSFDVRDYSKTDDYYIKYKRRND